MCGRYDNLIAREAYRLLFNPARLPRSNFPPRYNIAPTDEIPIIRVDPRDGKRELVTAAEARCRADQRQIAGSRGVDSMRVHRFLRRGSEPIMNSFIRSSTY